MLQSSAVIAFAASADLRQARVFYQQSLGLRLIEQNDFACVFDANGTMLRVASSARDLPQPVRAHPAGRHRYAPDERLRPFRRPPRDSTPPLGCLPQRSDIRLTA
jgi:catechol 2,3-dioxygenase-like lactoylglutathione lyase family enzyme